VDKNKILIANGDRLSQKSLYEMLCRNGYGVDITKSLPEALNRLNEIAYNAVILDTHEAGKEEFLKTVDKVSSKSSIIILTSYGNIEFAVSSIKMGAFDYLVKPVEDEKIISSIERALTSRAAVPVKDISKKTAPQKDQTYHGLVGDSQVMRDIYTIIGRIANSRATVLMCGESGTGKRLIAHALHKSDKKRCGRPFVEISCGGLPREIIESELFGHTKGAFTGAINDRKGRFEMADGGTILLDDIDCLPLDLQVKLLRVLQHKEFERVGDNKTLKVDVRIIASTNQDLEKAIAEKRFREDLYYRLNVISLHMPPLRERKEDIALLAEHFVEIYAKENHKPINGISKDLLDTLTHYSWPGNVRQLENIIERAVILDTDNVIGKEDLPDIIFNGTAGMNNGIKHDIISSLRDVMQEPEKIYILRVLEEVGWNKKKAATKLGVNRTTLYNKLRKYNITSGAEKN